MPPGKPARRHRRRRRHHPAGAASRAGAVDRRKSGARRSAACTGCSACPLLSIARACVTRRARAWRARLCARSRPAGAAARLRRTADRRHRQGAAAALPRPHSRRADCRAGEPRDHATVWRAAPPEGARHRHCLCVAPAGRDRGARRPLHRPARRPRGCGRAPRRVQFRRSRGGDDRPRRRATNHRRGNARRGVAGRCGAAPRRDSAARRRSLGPCRPARQRDDPSAAALFRPGAGRRRGAGQKAGAALTQPHGRDQNPASGLYRRRAGSAW